MLPVCYGVLLTIIREYYFQPGSGYTEVNGALHDVMDPNYPRGLDVDATNELHSKGRDVNHDVAQNFFNVDFQTLCDRCESKFLNMIPPLLKDEMIFVLKRWVSQDESIPSTGTIFQFPDELDKRGVTASTMGYSPFFVNLLLFIVHRSNNKDSVDFPLEKIAPYVKGWKKDFKQAGVVGIDSISPTLSGKDFDDSFCEVTFPGCFDSYKPRNFKAYHVRISNGVFVYDDMIDFLLANIGNYVFSRAQQNQFIKSGKESQIALQAVRALIGKSNVKDYDLGGLLLYCFLEKVLKAPKIMSNFELGQFRSGSKSNAVHLLRLGVDTVAPYHQLVFGTSDIETGLEGAIKNAFCGINEIKNNRSEEFGLIESMSFDQYFQPSEAKEIKELIIPSKNKSNKPEMAFGAFIGYRVELSKSSFNTPAQYLEAVESKMKSDISQSLTIFNEEIKKYGLENYSLYFYTMPFNDADTDKDEIMKDLLYGTGEK
jgi:hypothetical protein